MLSYCFSAKASFGTQLLQVPWSRVLLTVDLFEVNGGVRVEVIEFEISNRYYGCSDNIHQS